MESNFFLITFLSRSQNYEFASLIHSYGGTAKIINTPRQIVSSCSLSVKTDNNGFQIAQIIFKRRCFDSFNGSYKVKQIGHQINFEQVAI